jgi:hypothetical protein
MNLVKINRDNTRTGLLPVSSDRLYAFRRRGKYPWLFVEKKDGLFVDVDQWSRVKEIQKAELLTLKNKKKKLEVKSTLKKKSNSIKAGIRGCQKTYFGIIGYCPMSNARMTIGAVQKMCKARYGRNSYGCQQCTEYENVQKGIAPPWVTELRVDDLCQD